MTRNDGMNQRDNKKPKMVLHHTWVNLIFPNFLVVS
jgi:hypothetical protein